MSSKMDSAKKWVKGDVKRQMDYQKSSALWRLKFRVFSLLTDFLPAGPLNNMAHSALTDMTRSLEQKAKDKMSKAKEGKKEKVEETLS